jgi:predicted dienelactone hydrolase
MRHLVFLLACAPALAGPAWRDGPGPCEVVVTETIRVGDFDVRVTRPKVDAKVPVLVFSHGLYGSKDGYEPLARFWASHGYAVIQPTHPDSLKQGFKGQREAMQAWDERPKQISEVIDSLATIEEKSGAKLDRERIGVGGHSFGAHTAMLIGGAVAYPGIFAKGKSFRDARVKCTLLISPQGVGGLFRNDSWKDYAVPALVITGSEDTSPINDTKPEDRLDPFKLGPDGKMRLVWIEGAHHNFGGISGARYPGAGPPDDGKVWVVEQASLAFFDAFVKGDEKAAKWLADGDLAKTDRAKVRCEIKGARPADRE